LDLKEDHRSQMWWFMPVIPALGRLRQKDWKFEVSMDYIARLWLKTKKGHRTRKWRVTI
jgi:hypothetical protein